MTPEEAQILTLQRARRERELQRRDILSRGYALLQDRGREPGIERLFIELEKLRFAACPDPFKSSDGGPSIADMVNRLESVKP